MHPPTSPFPGVAVAQRLARPPSSIHPAKAWNLAARRATRSALRRGLQPVEAVHATRPAPTHLGYAPGVKRTPSVVALEAALALQPDLLARFGPGVSDAAIETFQRALGLPVPDDLLAFHAFRDGTVFAPSIEPTVLGYRVHRLEDILESKRHWDELSLEYEALPLEQRRAHAHWALWRRDWVPVLSNDHEVVALATEACFEGSPGQIISFDFKGGGGWAVQHASYAGWIDTLTALAAERLFDHHLVDTSVRGVWRRINPATRWFDQELPPGEEPSWPAEPVVIPVLPFTPGDAVTIVGGAFAGKPARFVSAVPETTRLRVEVSVFGQTAAVEIEASEVEPPPR